MKANTLTPELLHKMDAYWRGANGYAYRAETFAIRPATDYTARLISHCDDVAVPLEEAHILW